MLFLRFLLLSYALCASAEFFSPRHSARNDLTKVHHRRSKRASHVRRNATSTTVIPSPTGTPCAGNTAEDRSQWCEWDIDTDWQNVIPDTGVTREYWLELSEIAIAPDGYLRTAIAINGSIPGPTIFADWGDWVVIHVTNKLHQAKNGTSIHWHGIWQRGTNDHDGVVSITQCASAPGTTQTYRWRAEQYGSSWYHSHIGLQAWEGVFGGIIINGPATANYDDDAGLMILSDWTHRTADSLFHQAQTCGPPLPDNGLINGTNIYATQTGNETNIDGSRLQVHVEPGKSTRIRLLNAALDTHSKFSIDNHKMTVMAMDFVPIEPFDTYFVDIAMGQRYDIIITADQAAVSDTFWIRAVPQSVCGDNARVDDIRGILHYNNPNNSTKARSLPKSLPWLYAEEDCLDMPSSKLVPRVPKTVSPPDWQNMTEATSDNPDGLFRWYLNSTTMEVFWDNPTLLQVDDGLVNFPNSSAVIELPDAHQWVYLDIETRAPIPHPIHLHGHDFFILSQGSNKWNGTANTGNPPRRDTAMLPANGHLVIAFETDNPGAWLMHCHIGWHTTEGFALQFLERVDEIEGVDYDAMRDQCEAWIAYDEKFDIDQEDSGV